MTRFKTTVKCCLFGLLFLGVSLAVQAGEDLKHGPDSEIHEGVPRGKVEQQPKWFSKIFPGTERDWWIYVPAQYDPATPANVMIFQDGGGPVSEKSDMRAPIVMDNLIHKKEMPVTIGIFVNPGVLPSSDMSTVEVEVPGKDGAPAKKEKRPVKLPRMNRAFEYDSVGDRYARFLIEEILPEVEKRYKLTQDPAGRALVGQSSGGSCAFTAAWERPDVFGKVVSGIGSFTSLHGCNAYPDLIRKTEPKPIRIYMQDGSSDLDIYAGSWWHANNDMAAAFRWMGYDYFFLQGTGGHSGKQLGVNFPDAMRWLWRKDPVEGKRPEKADNRGVHEVLIKGEGWKKVNAYVGGDSADVDDSGNIYVLNEFCKISKLSLDGKIESFYESPHTKTSCLRVGPDGRIYEARPADKQVVAIDKDGKESVFAENIEAEAIAFNHAGDLFLSSQRRPTIICLHANKVRKETPLQNRFFAEFMTLTPDQGFLILSEAGKFQILSAKIENDGAVTNDEPFYTLQGTDGQTNPRACSAIVDDKGRLYVAPDGGIQIFDQGGRVIGILSLPERNEVGAMTFGGANFDTLYAFTAGGVYAHKLNAKGVRSCKPPIMVPPPRM